MEENRGGLKRRMSSMSSGVCINHWQEIVTNNPMATQIKKGEYFFKTAEDF